MVVARTARDLTSVPGLEVEGPEVPAERPTVDRHRQTRAVGRDPRSLMTAGNLVNRDGRARPIDPRQEIVGWCLRATGVDKQPVPGHREAGASQAQVARRAPRDSVGHEPRGAGDGSLDDVDRHREDLAPPRVHQMA